MSSVTSRLRSATADTFALVVYCFFTGMAIEILLSGMSLQQSLSSRVLAIPVNVIIAWPFGQYRDAVVSLASRHGPKQFWTRNLADLLAMSVFNHRSMRRFFLRWGWSGGSCSRRWSAMR